MPVMQCFAPGQFFDHVRSQCISCNDVCPPNKVPDKYCGSHCPQMPSTGEVNGPNDMASSSFNINILFATVVPIVAVLVVICIGIWVKWRRRGQRPVSNVDPSAMFIEMQPVNQPLSLCSNGEPESVKKEIRMGGYPEEDADHTATQLLPS